jgi:neutral ceramidase
MVSAARRLGSVPARAAASLLLLGALFSGDRLAAAQGRLFAGVGVTDITPASGGEFFGYVRPDIRADGVALRLTARALVLDDGAHKLALVTVDLQGPESEMFSTPTAKDSLVARLRDRGFTHDTVMLAGTHTHAGPTEYPDFLVEQVARAVRAADDTRAPARAAWAAVSLENGSDNRSIEAHLADHGFDLPRGQGSTALDPLGRLHTLDPVLSVLRIDADTPEGPRPLAAWAHFAAHATNFVPANTTYSADWPGVAVRRFAALVGAAAPLAIVTNGTEGDQSPRFAGPNQHMAADEMGQRVSRAMLGAWDAAGASLSSLLPLDARWTKLCFCGQEFAPGQQVSPLPLYGLPFIGGAEDGPSIFYQLGTEGQRRPADEADPIQGRKIVVGPAPYTRTPEVQALRVGDRLFLGVPGEPTVELGRRLEAAAASGAPAGVSGVLVVGLANNYTGYYTTPEEFDQQHYEGGHTVFGLWSGNLLAQTYRDLAAAMAAGTPGPPPAVQPAEGSTDPGTPPTGDGGVVGTLVAAPASPVERMQTFEVVWNGATMGRDRPVGAAFLTLERQQADGTWTAADSDLGYAFVWRENDGEYRARYDVARDFPLGTYRAHVESARYGLTTDPFAVVPSSALRVRGLTAELVGRQTRLDFVAQNPPPDRSRDILSRPRSPEGGRLRFQLGRLQLTAFWDPGRQTWTALVPGDATAATVLVAPGALRDGLGNASAAQAATTFTVGQVAPLDWPADIGPGGGPPPGPFGQGTFP